MVYSQHAFKLSLILSGEKFYKLNSTAFKNSRKNHRVYPKKGICHDEAFARKGMKVKYHDNAYKKKIKLVVNPTKMFVGNDVKKLWKSNRNNRSKLIRKIKEYITDYFDPKYELNDFDLTRMNFTVNVNMGDNKTVSAYIKVLRNIGRVKCFTLKYSKKDAQMNPDLNLNLSFDLEGNSHGVEFTAYDKEGESGLKEAKGILRIEVRLAKPKAIKKYTDKRTTEKQVKDLAKNSQNIFLESFTQIVPYGDYYKKNKLYSLLKKKSLSRKEKMIRLLELIPKKKSLYLARKEMNDRNVEKEINMFAESGLSPVTISKSHKVKLLNSLYTCLFEEK